jgi:hypothetical protein
MRSGAGATGDTPESGAATISKEAATLWGRTHPVKRRTLLAVFPIHDEEASFNESRHLLH